MRNLRRDPWQPPAREQQVTLKVRVSRHTHSGVVVTRQILTSPRSWQMCTLAALWSWPGKPGKPALEGNKVRLQGFKGRWELTHGSDIEQWSGIQSRCPSTEYSTPYSLRRAGRARQRSRRCARLGWLFVVLSCRREAFQRSGNACHRNCDCASV